MSAEEKIKELEQEIGLLKKNMLLQEAIIKELPDQVWVLEDDGTVYLCNGNIDKMISVLSKKPLRNNEGVQVYKELEHSAPQTFVEMIRRNDQIAKSTDRLMVFEERFTMGGKRRVLLSHKKRYIDPDTQKVYLLGTSMDITGIKKEEEHMMNLVNEMKEVSKEKKNFIQSFRHDLQTPVSNILGAVDLLAHSSDKPDLNFFMDSVQASAMKLREYIDQLEDITAAEKTVNPIEILEVNIHELLKNVLSSFHVLAKNKNLKLGLNISSTVPEVVNSDQVRLYRIISNLLSNAIKYTESGSVDIEVLYTVTDEGGLLEIQISDTGIGIDLSYHKSIFSPFLRLQRSDVAETEGQGLGLSIVTKFVDELMGQVSVNSAQGQGSQFVVMIPVN